MQLIRSAAIGVLAVAAIGRSAGAQAPGATASNAPGAADPAPAPETPTDDDYRDVLSEDHPPEAAEPADPDAGPPPTGTVRFGVYADNDRTTVYRGLGVLGRTWGEWSMTGTLGVDAVTSASLDVRASPLGMVDVVTSASGRSSTSGGTMTDRRYQVTAGPGWTNGAGAAANLNVALAKETDYTSASAGLNGSYDVLGRSTTLLGGVTFTDNWISSVIDDNLHEKLVSVGWSAGIARVLTRDDALRLRYDGQVADGYHASPYRNVRFGDWTAQVGENQIKFTNTIGSADGLPEKEPERRIEHAATLEWVHSLALGVGLHPAMRAAHDSWGVDSLSASLDLRVARASWRLQAGYRFYLQRRADFFQDKYVDAPAMYPYYTSDKDLGDQRGHLVRLDLSWVLKDAETTADSRMLLDLHLEAARYEYPGFTLLPQRDGVFASIGLGWEL